MFNRVGGLASCFLLLFLTGCLYLPPEGTETFLHPFDPIDTEKHSPTRFTTTIGGRSSTSGQRLGEVAHLSAAENTLGQGYKYLHVYTSGLYQRRIKSCSRFSCFTRDVGVYKISFEVLNNEDCSDASYGTVVKQKCFSAAKLEKAMRALIARSDCRPGRRTFDDKLPDCS